MTKIKSNPIGSHRATRVFGPLCFALASVACSSSTEPSLTLWEGNLEPISPGQVTGTVAAVSQFGRTEASIGISEAEAGATYTWDIRTGTCQAPGQIKGHQAQYDLLTTDEVGAAEGDVLLSLVFRSSAELTARVYRSLEDGSSEEAACGHLLEYDG